MGGIEGFGGEAERESGERVMGQRDETSARTTPATPIRRARIVWKDEDTGESLWLGLTGTESFFEDLGHAGFDLRRVPDSVGGMKAESKPNVESIPPSMTEPYAG